MSWAMAFNARDASPDIIALPSSPLRPLDGSKSQSPHHKTGRIADGISKNHQPIEHLVTPSIEMGAQTRFSSPSKSMIFDTPGRQDGAASGQSPWRIKVTVEAQPRDGENFEQRPVVHRVPLADEDTTKRKWKGTPIRDLIEPSVDFGAGDGREILGLLSSPPKRPRGRPRKHPMPYADGGSQEPAPPKRARGRPKKFPYERGTQRGQRLSDARNELDEAISDALGREVIATDPIEEDDDEQDNIGIEKDNMTLGPGELTVTENEAGDFSMISVESLETRRELHNSFGIGSRREDGLAVGEKSGLSVSYMPSSPPSQDKAAIGPSQATSATSSKSATKAPIPQPDMQIHVNQSIQGSNRKRKSIEPSAINTAKEVTQAPSPTPSDEARPTINDSIQDEISHESIPQQSTNTTLLAPEMKAEQRRREREERRHLRRQHGELSRTQPTQHTEQDSSTLQSLTRDEGETSQQYEVRKKSSWRERREERRIARQARGMQAERDALQMRAAKSVAPSKSTTAQRKPTGDDDLWLEEASREVDEEAAQSTTVPRNQIQQEKRHREEEQSLFAGEVIPPRRAKIPRTWRRSSGMDFMYSDSPEHLHPPILPTRNDSPTRNGVSKRNAAAPTDAKGKEYDNESPEEGGVLTPESSDDEIEQETQNDLHYRDTARDSRERQAGGETAADFTLPDAEATTILPHQHLTSAFKPISNRQPQKQTQPSSNARLFNQNVDHTSLSHATTTSTNNNSTGVFFQNRPRPGARTNPRRPRKIEQAMDLTDLLALNSSPALERRRTSVAAEEAIKSLHERAAAAAAAAANFETQESPARDVSDLADDDDEEMKDVEGEEGDDNSIQDEDDDEDADDDENDETSEDELAEADREMEEEKLGFQPQDYSRSHDISQSYEELLNKASPQKIKVRFNDSMNGNSSLLRPEREYSPVFGTAPTSSHYQQPQISPKMPLSSAVVAENDDTEDGEDFDAKSITPSESISAIALNQLPHVQDVKTKPGLLTRIFGPTLFPPHAMEAISASRRRPRLPEQLHTQPQQTKAPLATTLLPTEILQQPYPPSHRARLRSRYGVLPSTHPWTLAHMRTLHRMHNSVFNGKRDSIVLPPSRSMASLPPILTSMIGKLFPAQELSETSQQKGKDAMVVEKEDAWIIAAFFQVLVNVNVCGAMERGEVEVLGDGFAKGLRDERGKERLAIIDGERVRDGEEIGVEFVAACLGRVAEVQKEWEDRRELDELVP